MSKSTRTEDYYYDPPTQVHLNISLNVLPCSPFKAKQFARIKVFHILRQHDSGNDRRRNYIITQRELTTLFYSTAELNEKQLPGLYPSRALKSGSLTSGERENEKTHNAGFYNLFPSPKTIVLGQLLIALFFHVQLLTLITTTRDLLSNGFPFTFC